MKNTLLILTLLLATPLLVAAAVQTNAKNPVYIDCQPDHVVLYPGGSNVTWEALERPNNPVVQLLDKIQAHKETQYLVILARPESVKFFRAVRKLASRRPIDVGYDVVDADFKIKWQATAETVSPEATSPVTSRIIGLDSKPRPSVADKRPVFFECRQNEVFYIDKDGLDAQVAKLMSTFKEKKGDSNAIVKAMKDAEIGNDYYKVMSAYLVTMVMALEPRANVHGDNSEQLAKTDSKFQTTLGHLDPKTQYVVFLLRDDSFKAFRSARSVVEKLGFDAGWELLGIDEPIKFGTGRNMTPR